VDPQYGVSGSNIVMILGGTNDLASDDSSASVLSSLASYTSARRSVGWTVAIGTILPSGFFNGTQEARRLVVNTAIRDTLSTYGDLLVDFAADSRFDDLDGPNYQDRTHPTSAGTTIMAELVLAVIT
jgi:lysophospholipase L1-like esterase